ncbi:MAG: hypothetical protein ACM3QZ_02645 [Solirubrobacterales bacterium]
MRSKGSGGQRSFLLLGTLLVGALPIPDEPKPDVLKAGASEEAGCDPDDQRK